MARITPPPNALGFRVVVESERDLFDPRQPVCPICEAVAYGNLFCSCCVAHWEEDALVLRMRLRQGRQN